MRFRENETLQDLSKGTQSGGEKSVTTAVYMMALQELTQVPFRCVDEINQGNLMIMLVCCVIFNIATLRDGREERESCVGNAA